MKPFWIYILQVSNGNFYTGYTNNLLRRYKEHISGSGNCRYTRAFPPVALKQCWKVFENQRIAMKVESLIKKKTRKIKEEIIKKPGKLKSIIFKSTGLKLNIRTYNPIKINISTTGSSRGSIS